MATDVPATDPIPFGEWVPDRGNTFANGALLIQNALPYGEKYKPFLDLEAISAALGSACKGAFAYRDAAGTVAIFAGTATKLYKLSGSTWEDVTRTSGGDYTIGAENFWRFTNFGNLVIATNYVDDMQYFEVGVSTDFALLSATAPRARDIAVIKNFLVAIDTVDGDGAIGYRVRWSPINDPQGTWGSVPATQTDFQDLYDSVYSNTFITPFGDFGIIVQGRAIWRMDYVGGDEIFQFNIIDRGRGSVLTRSCVYNGTSIFMLTEDGYYEFDGSQMTPIGHEKMDEYYFENLSDTYEYNVCAAIDPIKKTVLWSVPHLDSTGGVCNKIYVFSWIDRRWAIIDEETEFLFGFLTTGYTLEDLDAISSSLDALPFSLDSRAWAGGKTLLGAFNSDHELGLFTGSTKTATLQTGEVRPNNSGRSILHSAIPYIEGGTVTARLGSRNLLTESVAWTSSISANPYTGEMDFDVDANFHRLEVQISGEWTTAHSVAIRQQPSGQA